LLPEPRAAAGWRSGAGAGGAVAATGGAIQLDSYVGAAARRCSATGSATGESGGVGYRRGGGARAVQRTGDPAGPCRRTTVGATRSRARAGFARKSGVAVPAVGERYAPDSDHHCKE